MLNAKRLAGLTNTRNDYALIEEVTRSYHGKFTQLIVRYRLNLPHLYHPHYLANPDQSLVAYPNHTYSLPQTTYTTQVHPVVPPGYLLRAS